jgi:predicted metalloprotease with PDZ domain
MTRFAVLLLTVLALGPGTASAQAPVRYAIAFPNRVHHEAEVTVTFPDLEPGRLSVRMSRTSPGRYALHEFAKNVYNVRATGVNGRPVELTRPNLHQWDISGHGGEVTISYTVYGDRADGTYDGIDRSHGHLNMPATFMWARGLEYRPIAVRVHVPDDSGWRVATQLVPTDDPYRFTARDLAYFMDSPMMIADFWESSWTVEGSDGPQTVRVALHHTGTEAEAESYAESAAAIVQAAEGVYGRLPDFDYGTYTFLACYLPWGNGDGMEHRNSTSLSSTGSLERNMLRLLGTVAHEFFHSWNVERVRPVTLEPFDFEHANMSRELWFAEGFTSYFDDLLLWRSELIDDADFARRMGGIANSVVNAPGRGFYSPVEMSMQAPFVDAATSVDPQNRQNTFLSYYSWGSGVALGLDLTLRSQFPGVTLDHLMREMIRSHGDPEVPYALADIQAALGRVTQDDAFAARFFHDFVWGRKVPDYTSLMAHAGIELVQTDPDGAWIGPLNFLREGAGRLTVAATPLLHTPLYAAGLDRGDRILSIDGRKITSRDEMDLLLDAHRPGDSVRIRFESRGETREGDATLGSDPALSARLRDDAADGAAFRAAWRSSTR